MTPETPKNPRRRWLVGAAAAVAGLAAGMAGQRWLESRRADAELAAIEALAAETGGFWTLSFPTPDGDTLAAARFLGRPLVLNFWGSWCPPCVKEMPEIDRFARDHPGLGVLGLAVDNPRAVREFLARTPVGYPIALAGLEGSELARKLGNSGGGLPFTVLFGSDGRVLRHKAGETDHAELSGWARELG